MANTIQNLDTQRYISFKQSEAINKIKHLSLPYEIENLRRPAANTRILFQTAPGSIVKHSVGLGLFTNSILNMGTDRHTQYVTDCVDGRVSHIF